MSDLAPKNQELYNRLMEQPDETIDHLVKLVIIEMLIDYLEGLSDDERAAKFAEWRADGYGPGIKVADAWDEASGAEEVQP